ncbi:carbohydrate-binding module family 48 protein [Collybiopsis luxurians FD-317 M1]|nr:carbohydrate-binding module family 48 protein [Collybiopsis luxurians FD-317 M1]
MGNNSSTAQSPQSHSTQQTALNGVHKSMRVKRRSLDLPDLATMYNYQSLPPRSSRRPIPIKSEKKQEPYYVQPKPHIENNVGRRVNRENPVSPVPSLPRMVSFQPNAPSPSRATTSDSLSPLIVRSSIPMALHIPGVEPLAEKIEPAGAGLVEHKITWNGGGNSVFVVHTSDNNSSIRTMMDKESETTFSTTISFPPGTHHIRFFVDGDWRVADDLPTAVNDSGSLSNYVNVELSSFTPPSHPSPSETPPGSHSPSSTGPIIVTSQPPFEGNDLSNLGRLSLGRSFWSTSTENGDPSESADRITHNAQWTTEIPLELIHAAEEEETYVQHAAQQDDPRVQKGFVPLPNIPPAPSLPRYLDKLILNQSHSQTTAQHDRRGDRRSTRDRQREREREKDREVPSPAGASLPVTTASGTDVTRGMRAHTEAEQMVPVMEALDSTESPSEAAALAMASIADDTSILPIPSHSVLHHLATSLIREAGLGGVIAVASTVRYKKKYLTTVYYKNA